MAKEEKIRSITRIYYLNPAVQKAIFEFSKNRETVPRYFPDNFGKRPDALIYPDDLKSLVMKGATSFHVSEELWTDPFQLNSDMTSEEQDGLRKAWDLLIDIDSPYLDSSKLATKLILGVLEKHGIKHCGIKFSGSKGFHLIIPSKAFPSTFQGKETKEMFPEWPRAISEYLMSQIKSKYNEEMSKWDIDYDSLKRRTKLSKEDVTQISCPNCSKEAKKVAISILRCDRCKNTLERPELKSKRKLKCIDPSCPGFYDLIETKEFFSCEHCGFSSRDKRDLSGKKVTYSKDVRKQKFSSDFKEEVSASKIGSLDLVLVAPRHLFRAPYSLHEKTALASVVITKEQLDSFSPRDADPLKVKVKDFYPESDPEEARLLLELALKWKTKSDAKHESIMKKKYESYAPTDFSGVTEEMFPKPIKKLLKGLKEGRKRGLFVLLTFLRSLNYSPAEINEKVREWNKKNDPPLKEGYIKSQIDWHIKQKKKILPPNYSNKSFYQDLNLIEKIPPEKNPLSEIARKINRKNS